jgi:hypothetical protein
MALFVAWIALHRFGYESFKYYHSISGRLVREGKDWTNPGEFYRKGILIANTGKAESRLGIYYGLGLAPRKPRFGRPKRITLSP